MSDPIASLGSKISNPSPRSGGTPNTTLGNALNIKWSEYIPHTPTPKQLAALMCQNVKELLYGGALGGGKSDYLAYEALRFCDVPGYAGIIFRRQLTDLKQPGALIPRIAEWLEPFRAAGKCKYVGSEHKWLFKTTYPGTDIPGPDAMLQFGYIGDAGVKERYQSAEYQFVGFDELGQWPTPGDWEFMASRCRITVCPKHGKDENNDPIWDDNCHICAGKRILSLRRRAAMNPGPAWVKRRWQIVPDPSQFKSKREALIAIQEGVKVNWVGLHPTRKFIPAKLEDNPHLSEKDYRDMLKNMSDDERSRLEDGNWEARKDSRFKRKWVRDRYIHTYPDGYCFLDDELRETEVLPYTTLRKIFTTSDCAATFKLFSAGGDSAVDVADNKTSKKPSATCIGVWGVTFDEQLLWLDLRKFRREIPDIVDTLIELNDIWEPQYNKIEVNGLGIGVAQYAHLAGLPVQKNNRKTDKLENSLACQMMMKNGQIYFPLNAEWIEEAEDDIFSWTGDPAEEDDVVDVVSDAALEITPTLARKIHQSEKRRKSVPFAGSSLKALGSGPARWGM